VSVQLIPVISGIRLPNYFFFSFFFCDVVDLAYFHSQGRRLACMIIVKGACSLTLRCTSIFQWEKFVK
jgi:hypothetical protein